MELSFKNRKLERKLTIERELIKSYGKNAKKVNQRIKELISAEDLFTVSKIPAMRLHKFGGNRNGEWSIDIHKNWRIIFTICDHPLPLKEDGGVDLKQVSSIRITSVEDPH